ncbi:hypothetical protein EDB86DRAFT_2839895 [Lactarius hatsudake]|nr:hypothetical protein EDB86DRAFT_2839895 [Lactarius hatsudake]
MSRVSTDTVNDGSAITGARGLSAGVGKVTGSGVGLGSGRTSSFSLPSARGNRGTVGVGGYWRGKLKMVGVMGALSIQAVQNESKNSSHTDSSASSAGRPRRTVPFQALVSGPTMRVSASSTHSSGWVIKGWRRFARSSRPNSLRNCWACAKSPVKGVGVGPISVHMISSVSMVLSSEVKGSRSTLTAPGEIGLAGLLHAGLPVLGSRRSVFLSMRGGADTHFNGRRCDSLAVLRNYARRLNGVSGSGLLGVGLTPTTDCDGDGDGDNGDRTRMGREKVGLAPTERDDDEEGLVPSATRQQEEGLAPSATRQQEEGLAPSAAGLYTRGKKDGFSLMLRSPGSFHKAGLESARLYDVYCPRDASLLPGKGLGYWAGR